MSVGAAALEAEVRKHRANDPKCSELGWVCVPCTRCRFIRQLGQRSSSHLLPPCILHHHHLFLGEMYDRLNFTLIRAITSCPND